MHAPLLHPKHPFVLAFFVFGFALLTLVATAPDLAGIDLSFGGGAPTVGEPTTPAPLSGEPAWVADPLSSPLQALGASGR